MQPTHNTATLAEHPTRRLDGAPETDADRRFFDLRAAGYTGWIDQDGYPATVSGSVPVGSSAAVNVARILRSAARYLGRYGWIQGCFYDGTCRRFTPPACLVGAVAMVCYGGPNEAPAHSADQPGYAEFQETLTRLDRFLQDTYGVMSFEFNDAKGRTAASVIRVLNRAADDWDEYFSHRPAHVDYPHLPGELYDCPVREARCFCSASGGQCVHCAIVAENHGGAAEASTSGGVA